MNSIYLFLFIYLFIYLLFFFNMWLGFLNGSSISSTQQGMYDVSLNLFSSTPHTMCVSLLSSTQHAVVCVSLLPVHNTL